MICTTYNYTEDGRVNLKTYIPDVYTKNDPLRPALITCPGGAWSYLAATEGEPVALTFVKEGFAGFVLSYSLNDEGEYPNPLIELAWAIRLVREHAEEWHIDPEKIVLSGFSAGSSIVALGATQWTSSVITDTLGGTSEMYKPNAVILGYGITSLDTLADNTEPPRSSSGKEMKPGKLLTDMTPEMNIADYVTENICPVFMFHTRYDALVPSRNTWILAQKMYDLGLPFEMHVFGSGHHGMSVNNRLIIAKNPIDPSVSEWVPLAISWLDHIFND